MPTHDLASFSAAWNETIEAFLAGGPAVPDHLKAWFSGYRGTGRGAIVVDAMPEPWVGPLDPTRCRGVMLGLNPGHAHLDFQARDGIFADEVKAGGDYATWASTWPYLREPWVGAKGPNRYHRSRHRFLQTWTDTSDLPASAMVVFEMYPWHSTSVTAAMRPDPGIIREWVLEPIRALDAPVFAFGAPWLDLLPRLGLPEVDRLGRGGRSYPTKVASRTVPVFDLGGQAIVAEKHSGSAGPPSTVETLTLRDALGHHSPPRIGGMDHRRSHS